MKLLVYIIAYFTALTCFGANTYYYDTVFKADVMLDAETASTACMLDASKNLISSSVTSTELGYVSGVTSAIQTQFDALDKLTTDADILYYNSGAYQRLAGCANGEIIKYSGGLPACGLDTGAGAITQLTYSTITKSADYTILDDDDNTTILVDDTSTDRVITLPTVGDATGRVITVINTSTDNGLVTTDGEGAEEIDGHTTIVLYEENELLTIQSNGTSWNILHRTLGQTVYFKDIKATGTAGGGSSVGWNIRTINTTENPKNWASLNANQITLQPGVYKIPARAPAYQADRHSIRFWNDTDSTSDIIGANAFCDDNTSGESMTDATLKDIVTITVAKTFELQHYISKAFASSGFGLSKADGLSSIYTEVEIERIGD